MKKFLATIFIFIMAFTLFACENTNTGTKKFPFSDFENLEFMFTSGAGAWRTVLTIEEDGSFFGDFFDAEMGAGKCYQSSFSGKFTEPVKVNDYTYSFTITSLDYEKEVGTEEQKEDYLYIYSDAYGIANAEELLIYLPEAPLSELPEDYKNWVTYQISLNGEGATELGFYGLYNSTTQCGFYSYDIVENLYQFIEQQGKLALSYEEELAKDGLEQDKKDELSYDIYATWNVTMQETLNTLEKVLSDYKMDVVNDNQNLWAAEKDMKLELNRQLALENDPSNVTATIHIRNAEFTKKRVYELLEYFK